VKYTIAIVFSTLLALSCHSQTIDNTNYYNHQTELVSTNWLRSSDAIPIIIDELLKNGIEYSTISFGNILKINDSTRLAITISFEKNDKEFGFIYEETHGIPLNVHDRDFLKNRNEASYVQAETDTAGETNFMMVDPLPSNLFLLKQRCYWFNFDEKGTKFPVSKEVIKQILRQDIREYLKTAK